MNDHFNRFENQCEGCTCYSGNVDEGTAVDPDCECSLGHDIGGDTMCDDVDSISLYKEEE